MNHRPVIDVDEVAISAALHDVFVNPLKPEEPIVFNGERLKALMQTYGEVFDSEEWQRVLETLLEEHPEWNNALPAEFSPEEFISEVLGFEPVPVETVLPPSTESSLAV